MLSWFQKPIESLAGGALVLGFFSFVSRLFGLWRDRVLAGTFGAGDTLDVYYAAFRIPDLLFALLITGALSASFIPLFVRHLRSDGVADEGWAFTNRMLIGLGVLFGAGALLGILFAPLLAELVAPGFSSDKQQHVAFFMRVLFLAEGLIAVSSVFSNVLQATQRFALFALSPVLYNIGIILGAVFFVPAVGAIGLAWGVVLGAFLHMAIPVWGSWKMGYRPHWPKPWFHADVSSALLLFGPRVLGIGMSQIQFIILGVLASALAAGSVTVFQFAYNLTSLPVGILAVSFAISAFPLLSRAGVEGDTSRFADIMSEAVRQILYLIIPATLFLLLLRAQTVRLVLGAGTFGWEETLLVADTLAFLVMSLFAQALNLLFIRAFFAYRDSVTPLVAGALSTLVLLLSAGRLTEMLGIVGLGIAFSLAQVVELILLWAMLRVKVGAIHESKLLRSLLKMTVAGLFMAIGMQVSKPLTVWFAPLDTFAGVFLQTAVVGSIGTAIYLSLSSLFHVEEFGELRALVHRHLFRRFRPAEALPVANNEQVL